MYRKFGSNRFEPSSQNFENHRTENRTDSPKSVDQTELNLNRRFGSFSSRFLHQFGTKLWHHYFLVWHFVLLCALLIFLHLSPFAFLILLLHTPCASLLYLFRLIFHKTHVISLHKIRNRVTFTPEFRFRLSAAPLIVLYFICNLTSLFQAILYQSVASRSAF